MQVTPVANPSQTDTPPRKIRRAVSGAAMGNCVEWYDFGVFGFMPAILGKVFFDADSTSEGALATFALLAVTFVVRPFGGFVLGPLGDKLGRRKVLALTVILMSGATFAIGLLPTWSTVGPLAAVLVIALRLLQGFSAGGEYGGAATFIAEYAPARRRGFFGSWLEFGTLVGFLAGAGSVTLFTLWLGDDAMSDWGWRLPFLIAGPLGIVGFYLRNRLSDTPLFREVKRNHQIDRTPLRTVLTGHWRSVLHLIGVAVLLGVADYVVLAYLETYLANVVGFSGRAPLVIIVAVIACMLLVIVPIGALSDRIGRKPILLTMVGCYLVLPIPAFSLMAAAQQDHNPVRLAAGISMIALPLVLFLAVIASTLPAMFPTRERYTGFSVSYGLAAMAFGGTTPFVVQSLVDHTGNQLAPAFYLMGAAAITAIPILLLPETKGLPLGCVVDSRTCDLTGGEAQPTGRSALVRELEPAQP